jgi:phosphotransferase system HPr (HPr) family protein
MRPAKDVVKLANSFPCNISLVTDGREVDAKSILALIGLGAECGAEMTVRANGVRAEEAAARLGEMLASLPELHGEPADWQEESGPTGRSP